MLPSVGKEEDGKLSQWLKHSLLPFLCDPRHILHYGPFCSVEQRPSLRLNFININRANLILGSESSIQS